MRERYNNELKKLNEDLSEMGKLIELAIQSSVIALMDKDTIAAEEIIKNDDVIDQKEKDIESLCVKLLLQQQPMASDLRVITSALKIVTDMERIGDHAADIASLIIKISDFSFNNMANFHQISSEIISMLHDSVEAYTSNDINKALAVIAHDDIVDDLFCAIKRDLILEIRKSTDSGEQIADYLLIAKYFERIGDHATNIAEWVIYSITGKFKR